MIAPFWRFALTCACCVVAVVDLLVFAFAATDGVYGMFHGSPGVGEDGRPLTDLGKGLCLLLWAPLLLPCYLLAATLGIIAGRYCSHRILFRIESKYW